MAGCFDNLIGLKELCELADPVSGINMNDIGYNRQLISDVLMSDSQSELEFFQDRLRAAINEISIAILGKFGQKVSTRSLIENQRLGFTDTSHDTVAGSGYMGISMKIPNKANYISLEVASIELQLTTSETLDLLIYDLDQALLLDTIPITTVAGEIATVYPHKIINSYKKYRNLWVGYDATGLDSIKTIISSNLCCGRTSYSGAYVESKGASVAGGFLIDNLSTLSHTAGLSVTYSLACDSKGWLCDCAHLFALAIAHKIAMDTYRIGMMVSPNSRSNNSTTVNKELMQENFIWHELQYNKQMDAILPRIHLPQDSICFECYSPVTFATAIP